METLFCGLETGLATWKREKKKEGRISTELYKGTLSNRGITQPGSVLEGILLCTRIHPLLLSYIRVMSITSLTSTYNLSSPLLLSVVLSKI